MNFTGTKYEATQHMDIAQITALVRADIKAAVKDGSLVPGNYSVTISRYSMGESITVRFSKVNVSEVWNTLRIRFDMEHPHASHCNCPPEVLSLYSAEITAITDKVEAIVNAYNYDKSDSASDYHNDRFHVSVGVAAQWADDCREAAHKRVAAAIEADRLEALRAAGEAAVLELGLVANDATDAHVDFLTSIGAM